ncbi:hypothetical protein PG984_002513 [Apiospora sp. TS-2023a]
MDHLTRSAAYSALPPRVPFLDGCRFDGRDFASFPARAGFNKHRLLRGDFTEHDPRSTACFLQAWLFFGLISTAFSPDFDQADYIYDDGQHGPSIVTKSLPGRLRDCVAEISRGQKRKEMQHCLEEISYFQIHLSNGTLAPTQCPLPPEVSLSIMSLFSAFNTTMFHALGSDPTRMSMWRIGVSSLLHSKMESEGWCPNELWRLTEHQSTPLLYFASTIQRPTQHMHNHSGCSSDKCMAYQVRWQTYRTKHVVGCDDCVDMAIPVAEAHAILARGKYPLIIIEPSPETEAFTLTLTESRRGLPYVAISHVWSDGLGNVNGNALPACQVARLYFLAKSVAVNKRNGIWSESKQVRKGAVALWMDTLCIPRAQPYRGNAISLIHVSFVRAGHVLVLDADLQLTSWRTDIVEILVRIIISGWMRRVWTLLEGSLGVHQLHVQCQGAALCLKDCIKTLSSKWQRSSFQFSSLQIDVCHFYWELGLKPIEVKALYETPIESRMEKLYSLLAYVPQGLLFCRGVRCKAAGLRWAPLDFRRARPYRQYRPATLYPGDGLEVVCPGFILGSFPVQPRGFIFRQAGSASWWRADYDMEPSADYLDSIEHISGQTELGIICPSTQLTRLGPRDFDAVPAALVSIYKTARRTKNILAVGRTAIYCRFLCVIVISRPESAEVGQRGAPNEASLATAEAQRAPVFVGQHLRQCLGMTGLADAKEEWLDQTCFMDGEAIQGARGSEFAKFSDSDSFLSTKHQELKIVGRLVALRKMSLWLALMRVKNEQYRRDAGDIQSEPPKKGRFAPDIMSD